MSSMLSSLNRNIMRMSGLSSGLDTGSMVADLMKIEQMKVDKQWKLMTKTEWKKDNYSELTKTVKDFRAQFLSVLNQSKNMLSANNFKAKSVKTTDTSGAVTITAGANAELGTRSIKVEQLAAAATGKSAELTSMKAGDAFKTSTTLGELQDMFGGDGAIFAAGETSATITIQGMVNGEAKTASIELTSDMTVKDMMDKINQAGVGVTMSYSSLERQFVLKANETGANNGFNVSGGGTMFSALNNQGDTAKDAIVSFYDAAGVKIGDSVTSAKNNITVDGVGFQLNKVTTGATGVEYTVSKDNDSIVNMVKGFIEGYNKLIETFNGKLTEKANKAYGPLTADERAALSDKEAEEWDKLAKSGMLRNDATVRGFLSDLRGSFYTAVGGTGSIMASIGITTTSSYFDGGKLQFDEEKFRAALEKDPDKVANMFVSGSNTGDNRGLVTRISDSFNAFVKKVDDIDMVSVERQIKLAKERLEKMTTAMAAKEESYYRKFSAMETLMSQLNSQSGALSGLSSMGGK